MFIVDRREKAGKGKAEHGQQNKPDHERKAREERQTKWGRSRDITNKQRKK